MGKRTALYECHKKYKGKIVDFAGWDLSVEFAGLMKEHLGVRQSCGLFDVSHMGEIEVKGEKALEYIQKMTTNNAALLKDGQVQYSLLCYENGGIVDDLLVHRFNDKHFFLCVNASNIEKDYQWLLDNNKEGLDISNISDQMAQLAVQGPDSEKALQNLTSIDLKTIDRYWFTTGELAGKKNLIIARTGYTGEDGFEVYSKPEDAPHLWEAIMECGSQYNIQPCGLGARDTLRLEVKYALYGNDIDKDTNPYEATLGWVVSKKKGEFIGRNPIMKAKEEGLDKKLVGFGMLDRGIPRHGYEIYSDENTKVGLITSGTYSPSLKKPIALGYVPMSLSKAGTELFIKIRDKLQKAQVVKTPFVTGTSLDKFMKK